jgi:hypothetical protein
VTTTGRTDRITLSIFNGKALSEMKAAEHVRALEREEAFRIVSLKAAHQSCSSCACFARIKYTTVCTLKRKPIGKNNIFHRHQQKKGAEDAQTLTG